jgi:hypothetical protein
MVQEQLAAHVDVIRIAQKWTVLCGPPTRRELRMKEQ